MYLERGRVLLGIGKGGQMRHQLGVVEGPAWLDAAFVLQRRGSSLDMLADSDVRVQQLPQTDFLKAVSQLPPPAQQLLQDMAQAYCAQTELAVSRLSKDAEARCAQWLLRHADRKSTRLNSSHLVISYAVFCLKKKNHSEFKLL